MGISMGIEKFCKFAMPILFIMGIFLALWVFTLHTAHGSAVEGFNFLWDPKWEKLSDPKVWLAAAGQVFFTLSLGFGAIVTYASYLKKDQDITASALTSASLNEFAEVILGASIAIPAAVAFFGLPLAQEIAKSGSFALAFISLPAIFSSLPLGAILAFIWFLLLFLLALHLPLLLRNPLLLF